MDKYLTYTTGLVADGLNNITNKITSLITFSYSQAHIAFLHLWGVLTYQQMLMGFQMLAGGIIYIVGSIIVYRFLKSVSNNIHLDQWDKGLSVLGLAIVALWFLLSGVQMVIASAPHILNPEYYALQESIQILSQLKQ